MWDNNGVEFNNQLNNHILVFCLEDILDEFLRILEHYHNEVIFFVSDKQSSEAFNNLVDYHGNLIYLECSYSDLEELSKLNLEKSKHIFILSCTIENTIDLDSGILPLVKRIEENFKGCKYTIELCDQLNIRYLKKSKLNNSNPFEKLPNRFWPVFAKSDIFFPSSLDGILAMAYYNEGQLEILLKMLEIRNLSRNIFKENTIENSKVTTYQYKEDNPIRYDTIFSFLVNLDDSIIPLGIYRNKVNAKLQNEDSYMVTNPKKDTLIYYKDLIMCLGRSEKIKFERNEASPQKRHYSSKKNNDSLSSLFDSDENLNKSLDSDFNLSDSDNSNSDYDKLTLEELKEKLQHELNNYGKNEGDIVSSFKQVANKTSEKFKPIYFKTSVVLTHNFDFETKHSVATIKDNFDENNYNDINNNTNNNNLLLENGKNILSDEDSGEFDSFESGSASASLNSSKSSDFGERPLIQFSSQVIK